MLTTYILHVFGIFRAKAFILEAYRSLPQLPIWQNFGGLSDTIGIMVITKFSREFSGYLPYPSLLVPILAENSLENFQTTININICRDVYLILLPPYVNIKNSGISANLCIIYVVSMQLYVVIMQFELWPYILIIRCLHGIYVVMQVKMQFLKKIRRYSS